MLGFLAVSVIKLEPVLVDARKEVRNLDQKIADLKRADSEQKKLGDYFKSPAYLEWQARLRLNYKKSDEKVVYVYERERDSQQGAAPVRQGISDSPLIENLKKWLGYLFD